MSDQFDMNNIELCGVGEAKALRDNLKKYEQNGSLGGVRNACLVPPDVLSMAIMLPGTEGRVSNFRVHEFANGSGIIKLHPTLIIGAQAVRDALNAEFDDPIGLYFTCGFRSQQDQYRLAVTEGLGWTGDGGKVAKNSMHLHGVAGDMKAKNLRTGQWLIKHHVEKYAGVYFDYVKVYSDTGHVHGDQRYKAGIASR